MPGGRPSKYTEEFAIQAEKLCKLGATSKELADFFTVNVRTIERWASEHEEFCRALKVGKAEADDRVERSLFHRANGYSHEAVKIFMPAGATKPVYARYVEHVAPDTTACIFWLKNRRPDLWRDVTRTEHSGKVEVEHTDARAEVERRIAGLASRNRPSADTPKPNGSAVH